MQSALELRHGARFYRFALQVNPFAYTERHNKQTSFQSETEYNKGIVETCLDLGIEVIGVTDYYRRLAAVNALIHRDYLLIVRLDSKRNVAC